MEGLASHKGGGGVLTVVVVSYYIIKSPAFPVKSSHTEYYSMN